MDKKWLKLIGGSVESAVAAAAVVPSTESSQLLTPAPCAAHLQSMIALPLATDQ